MDTTRRADLAGADLAPGPTPSAVDALILRFTRAERALHWATAAAVLTCAVTGFVLYVGWPAFLIGRRTLLRDVHVIAGVAMPLPLIAAYAGRWRASVRADVRRLARWTRADRRWLLSRGRDATGEVGKFNAGQKANAAFTLGMIPVMLATGAIMRWYDPLGVDIAYRTGATFVHDWVAVVAWVVVAGHIAFALFDRTSLRGMLTGRVGRAWAEDRHPRWAAEVARSDQTAGEAPGEAATVGDRVGRRVADASGTRVGERADRPLR